MNSLMLTGLNATYLFTQKTFAQNSMLFSVEKVAFGPQVPNSLSGNNLETTIIVSNQRSNIVVEFLKKAHFDVETNG